VRGHVEIHVAHLAQRVVSAESRQRDDMAAARLVRLDSAQDILGLPRTANGEQHIVRSGPQLYRSLEDASIAMVI